MRSSDSVATIAPALVRALAEIQHATKNAENPHFRSRYADLTEVLDTAKPALLSHGIAVLQVPGWGPNGVTLTTRLIHESGEWIEGEAGTPVPPIHGRDRDGNQTVREPDAQMVGSAITYLRRYSLAAMCAMGQEDDDANSASHTAPHATTQERAPAPKTPSGSAPTCPKCGGGVWDNRRDKKNPKGPDYKCKDKEGCDWAFWVDGAVEKLQEAVTGLVDAGVVTVEDGGHVMDGARAGDLDKLQAAQDWCNSKRKKVADVE